MLLGILSNPFKQEFLSVAFKCGMVSVSFLACITLCQGMPNIFRLNFEDSSNGFDGQLFSEFIPCKGFSIEDLVGAKVRIDKIVVEK
jgi:hypothetical protein